MNQLQYWKVRAARRLVEDRSATLPPASKDEPVAPVVQEAWDSNPDGVKPGQDSPVRMDTSTGAFYAPEDYEGRAGSSPANSGEMIAPEQTAQRAGASHPLIECMNCGGSGIDPDTLGTCPACHGDRAPPPQQPEASGAGERESLALLYLQLTDAMGYDSGKDGIEFSPEEWAADLLRDATAHRAALASKDEPVAPVVQERERTPADPNCATCGGIGSIPFVSDDPSITGTDPCPACRLPLPAQQPEASGAGERVKRLSRWEPTGSGIMSEDYEGCYVRREHVLAALASKPAVEQKPVATVEQFYSTQHERVLNDKRDVAWIADPASVPVGTNLYTAPQPEQVAQDSEQQRRRDNDNHAWGRIIGLEEAAEIARKEEGHSRTVGLIVNAARNVRAARTRGEGQTK